MGLHTSNVFNRANLVPVNRVAARVVTDPCLEPAEESAQRPRVNHFATLPSMKPIPSGTKDLTGYVVGKLTVIGLCSGEQTSKWVARCICGYYTMRTAAAITHPKKPDDACEECRRQPQP